MGSLYVANHISLDGVIQGPGRPEEDTSGGFASGGWSAAGMNEQIAEALASRVAEAGGMRLLLGRRSYDDMLAYWNSQDSPFGEGLNNAPKYVVSRNTETTLPWPNSTLITGDVPDVVRALKQDEAGDLCIMGSSELVKTLLEHQLIDELLLFVHPLLLGSGKRLFPGEGHPTRLEQLACVPTSTGVMIAHYHAREETGAPSSP